MPISLNRSEFLSHMFLRAWATGLRREQMGGIAFLEWPISNQAIESGV